MSLNWELCLRNIRKEIETWKLLQSSLESRDKNKKEEPSEVTDDRTFWIHFDF